MNHRLEYNINMMAEDVFDDMMYDREEEAMRSRPPHLRERMSQFNEDFADYIDFMDDEEEIKEEREDE